MSGYAFAMAACAGCNRLFSFNPCLVPSIGLDGARQPICKACVEIINRNRFRHHLAPIKPLPGAYEPISEDQSP
jgi:hypothetical protein